MPFFLKFAGFWVFPTFGKGLGGILMMYKVFLAAVILFLSSACLPHVNFPAEKVRSDVSPATDGGPSLFTRSEMDGISSRSPSVSWSSFSSPAYNLEGVGLSPLRQEPPVSDECNDDFNLEVLPDDPPKRGGL